jgi:hypothetical protein
MKVRGSRGKLVLVKVKNMLSDYYVTGKIEERTLTFKDRKKESRLIILPKDKPSIYRSMGISCIDIDDEKNAVVLYSNALVAGFDAVKYKDLYTRALYKPSLVDTKQMIIIILLVLVLIGLIVVGALVFRNGKMLQTMAEITQNTISTILA